MRRENIPAGGHDKVIWKSSRDRIEARRCNSQTWWRCTTVTLLDVSFGSYRRRRRDVLMGRRGYVPLKRLGTYHSDAVGCFIWDLFEALWRHTTETSWWRSTEMSLGVSFEMYLPRRWDVQRDVVTTSPRRLVAGWDMLCFTGFQRFGRVNFKATW